LGAADASHREAPVHWLLWTTAIKRTDY
jgi:hypothetical protein